MPDLFSSHPIVAFDVETTGFNPTDGRVIELGAVRRDPDGKITEFSRLVNPEMTIPPEATEVHGIKDSDLYDKPKIAGVLPSFIEFIKDAYLVGHNVPFDVGFLSAELQRADIDMPTNIVLDTLTFSRQRLPGYQNYKLGHLANMLKLGAAEAHRATEDSHTALKLFDACVKTFQKAGDVDGDGKPIDRFEVGHLQGALAFPNFAHQGRRLLDDTANSIRFGIKPMHFATLKAAYGQHITMDIAGRDFPAWVTKLIGVVVEGGFYKKVPKIHLMTRNSKGEDKNYDLAKVGNISLSMSGQTGLFS